MQAKNGSIILTVIAVGVVLLLGMYWLSTQIPDAPEIVVPTADEIAAAVLAGVTIPTASDIAASIDIPDTKLSVHDYKDELASDLSVAHLDDDDFKEELSEFLNKECGIDIDERDIEGYDIVDIEVNGRGEEREVILTVRVDIDDDGDAERVKVDIGMQVVGLDRDDDYEDAEVEDDGHNPYNFEFLKGYDDFCE